MVQAPTSHVIARVMREMNILTVGVTTLPFTYEGPKRMRRAVAGLEELKKYLDTTILHLIKIFQNC